MLLENLEKPASLEKDQRGYFSGLVVEAQPGMRYRYRLDGEQVCPDPCSRYQPEGPHGPSLIVDPHRYQWKDRDWAGVQMQGQVIYELHVGTCTAQGTFDAAVDALDDLKGLGITLIELMPIAEFPGRWNWGYDGVGLYASAHMYGDAEALKRFVDAAHARGLGVILDVVYNHLGPDGNYLSAYQRRLFHRSLQERLGSGHQFRWTGSYRGAGILYSKCLLLDRRISSRWTAARMRRRTFMTKGPVHILADITRRARAAAGPRFHRLDRRK